MTGAERLEQVREALQSGSRSAILEVRYMLDGCVLLTAEEAEAVADCLMSNTPEALALLTPDQEARDE